MKKQLAQGISVLLHPLLIPSYLFGMLLLFFPLLLGSIHTQMMFMGIIIIATFIIPTWLVLFLRYTKVISSIYLQDRKERTLPFLGAVTIYILTTILIYRIPTDSYNTIPQLMLLMTFSLCLTAFITLFWKISAHMVGFSGIVGVLMRIAFHSYSTHLMLILFVAILLAGILMSARLYLNAHTPKQVYIGFLIGFSISFTANFWILT
ncbi:MAG: hypothetical protein GY827_02445 [Cytophagales bacterium]|nr:hypothetical protein [Cytophagales bacterium]